jgi:quinoprotein glucose dehydrogenase
MSILRFLYWCGFLVFMVSCQNTPTEGGSIKYDQWADYLGGPDRNHYTTLDKINRDNVKNLQVAWEYTTPDSGQMQMNAIIVDTILYGISAGLQVFALHGATGKELWTYGDKNKVWHSTSRGVSYWADGKDRRILFTAGSYLYALDAISGAVIKSFGQDGRVDLHTGLPDIAQSKFIISNTPGTVYKDLIIMPLRLSEGTDAAPGDIRAFDVRTGALRWTFHTIPYPGEFGYETWENQEAYKNENIGAANNWAGMAVDNQTGIIYIPIGSASPDFYGANRLGSNLFSDCLIALDANSGERIWHQQLTHHDIWDRDPPAPPNLIEVFHKGTKTKAVAQVTKQGYIFLYDRLTGEPLFEIEEIPVPTSNLTGEKAWLTQPRPKLPAPFARQSQDLTTEDISPYATNPDELKVLLEKSNRQWYAPPDTSPVLLLPGYDGAAEWGGAGADPYNGIIYVNSNEMAWILRMESNTVDQNLGTGARLYSTHCAHCHQKDRQGIAKSGFPSLIDIDKKMKNNQILTIITDGKGMMTGLPYLSIEQKEAIVNYLVEPEKMEVTVGSDQMISEPYKHTGYNKFLDANGLPGLSPPWGTLHAIDLNTGQYQWSIPYGETLELMEKGHPTTGTESYGGPIITSNGLIIIAGTKDRYISAFARSDGALLWRYQLPYAAFATPSTYQIDGKQYITIACGGEKLGTEKGNKMITFALPD